MFDEVLWMLLNEESPPKEGWSVWGKLGFTEEQKAKEMLRKVA